MDAVCQTYSNYMCFSINKYALEHECSFSVDYHSLVLNVHVPSEYNRW